MLVLMLCLLVVKKIDPKALTPAELDAIVADVEKGANAQPTLPNPKPDTLAPSALDNALGVAEGTLNKLAFAPFVTMPLGALGSGLSRLGEKGVPLAGGLGKALSAPQAYLAKPLEQTFLAKPIMGLAQGISDVSAGIVGGIARATGLGPYVGNRHTRLAESSFGKAQGFLRAVKMDELPEALRGHVQEIHKATSGVAGIAHTNIEKLEGTLKAAKEKLGEVPRAARKPIKKAIAQLESAVYHHNGAASMKDVSGTIRAIPGKLGKMDLGHTVMNGSFVAMSGISMATDARSFTKNLATLKQMYHDLTGKEASTVGVLFGSVPKVVAEARSHLLKNILIHEGTDVAGVLVNLKGLLNPAFGGLKAMAAFMLPQFASQGADMLMGESVLPTYQALKQSFDPKQKMPVEYYQAFLGAMSSELKKHGGENSAFTKAVAEQYAKAQAAPQQMLKDIESGALTKRIEAVIEANKAAAPEAPIAKEKSVIGKHTQQVISRESGVQQATGHAVT
jgi:hypothetical protein